MKNNRLTIAALILAVLLFTGWQSTAQRPARVQWEYSHLVFRDDPTATAKKLNELGADGWEIIQFFPARDSAFLGAYLLKRPKG